MKVSNLLKSLVVLNLGLLVAGKGIAVAQTKSNAYIPINNYLMNTYNGIQCELITFISVDNKSAKIIRVDPPKGKVNFEYLLKSPLIIEQYGSFVDLTNDDYAGKKIKNVGVRLDINDQSRDFIFEVNLFDGSKYSKRISVNEDFYKDHADHCLK